jgi:hypothetical protein
MMVRTLAGDVILYETLVWLVVRYFTRFRHREPSGFYRYPEPNAYIVRHSTKSPARGMKPLHIREQS